MLRTTLIMSMVPMAILALALAGSAHAQQAPPGGEPPDPEVPDVEPPDPEIPGLEEPHPLVVLHAINQIQSQLGLMGVNEAQNPEVREFASDLAESHHGFDREMLETANELDIDVAGSGEVRMAMEERLQNLDPQLHMLMEAPRQIFDTAFLDLVELSQQDAIETVEALVDEVEEPQAQRHMNEALAGYRAHLERARELQETIDEDAQPEE